MPFKEIKTGKNKGKYKSPNGRILSKEQVLNYYSRVEKNQKKSQKTNK